MARIAWLERRIAQISPKSIFVYTNVDAGYYLPAEDDEKIVSEVLAVKHPSGKPVYRRELCLKSTACRTTIGKRPEDPEDDDVVSDPPLEWTRSRTRRFRRSRRSC